MKSVENPISRAPPPPTPPPHPRSSPPPPLLITTMTMWKKCTETDTDTQTQRQTVDRVIARDTFEKSDIGPTTIADLST